jgi:hypothetical protein
LSDGFDLLWYIAKHGTPKEKKDLLNKLLKERERRLEPHIKEICDRIAGDKVDKK